MIKEQDGYELEKLAENLLMKVKLGDNINGFRSELCHYSSIELINNLRTDRVKKAFWINIYNAIVQIDADELKRSKMAFFGKKRIRFKDLKLSLDDIEHNILRRGKYKYSLGFFRLFSNKRLKAHWVSKLDFRIHFALNCGAKSCPAIFSYNSNRIDLQLDMATDSFLEQSVFVDHERRNARVSKLLLFYLKDFGGFKGIRNLLKEKGFITHANYKIRFDKYDWSIKLNNFAEHEPI